MLSHGQCLPRRAQTQSSRRWRWRRLHLLRFFQRHGTQAWEGWWRLSRETILRKSALNGERMSWRLMSSWYRNKHTPLQQDIEQSCNRPWCLKCGKQRIFVLLVNHGPRDNWLCKKDKQGCTRISLVVVCDLWEMRECEDGVFAIVNVLTQLNVGILTLNLKATVKQTY